MVLSTACTREQILVVMAAYPFPPKTGGEIVACNNIQHLSEQYSLTMICLSGVPQDSTFKQCFERIEIVGKTQNSKPWRSLKYILNLFRGIPVHITAHHSNLMNKKVKQAFNSRKFEAVIAYGINTMQYIPQEAFDRTLVNIEDPDSIKHQRWAQLPINSIWIRLKLNITTWSFRLYEKRMFAKFAKIILLSQADIDDIQFKSGISPYGSITYGVDAREVTPLRDRVKNTIVFSGNMFHEPNIDGALFFLDEIFPLVLKQHPQAIFWLVGRSPDQRIMLAAKKYSENILITGEVDDPFVYIKKAIVCICPVRLKIGVQTKILEALSVGTPVVTTSAGNSGISGVSGRELWVEDDPVHFSNKVISLLNQHNWERFSHAGVSYIREKFTWQRSFDELQALIREVIRSVK